MADPNVAVSTPSGVLAESNVDVTDEFGRTEDERTVMLDSKQAEQVNREVEVGKHESYDEALEYVIERGFAEIGRQRASAAKAEQARRAAKGQQDFNNYLRLDPTIVTDPKRLMKLMTECGIVPRAA